MDEEVIQPNNRIYIPKNVGGERAQDNITYWTQDRKTVER